MCYCTHLLKFYVNNITTRGTCLYYQFILRNVAIIYFSIAVFTFLHVSIGASFLPHSGNIGNFHLLELFEGNFWQVANNNYLPTLSCSLCLSVGWHNVYCTLKITSSCELLISS